MTQPAIPASALVLLDEFQRSGLRELHVRSGDFELFLSNDSAAQLPAGVTPAHQAADTPGMRAHPAPAAPPPAVHATGAQAKAVPDDAQIVSAPNLGTFYRAPKPGADSYVELGSVVAPGDKLCLIEVMKLFTSVTATSPGRIAAVLVEDGAMVEAGQPLFAVVAG